ncbi:MAG: type I 3-dehydroquinate dehydratase [Acidobacteriota bacterium]
MQQSGDATLIATLTEAPSASGEELSRLPAGTAWLEVRGDLVGELDPDWLRERFAGRLLFTLRSRDEGGAFDGSADERRTRLTAAASRYDLVDLEGVRDRDPRLLAAIDPERRVISWHGPASDLSALRERFAQLSTIPASIYKLVPGAESAGEELAPLALLKSLGRADLVAFASGRLGAWTRLVAPRLGAALVYGAASRAPGAPGQPTLQQLVDDFGLPRLRSATALCGVVGDPVEHSLSPRLHNALYRELGVEMVYLPLWVPSFGNFWLEVVESGSLEILDLPWKGLSVTAPHKAAALAVAGAASPLADRVGGANTLVHNGEVWEAESTDPAGVVGALRARGVALEGRRAAVLGSGGAGRAAAVALQVAGARVSLVNRGGPRGLAAAADLGLPLTAFETFDPSGFEIVVNATSLGREGQVSVAADRLSPRAVLIDMVYDEQVTPSVAEARRRGITAIDGREILLFQGLEQFRLMTGREAPLEVARRALGLEVPA